MVAHVCTRWSELNLQGEITSTGTVSERLSEKNMSKEAILCLVAFEGDRLWSAVWPPVED